MIFSETPLRGAFVIEPEPIEDERGYFCRIWCEREFDIHGLKARWVQTNVSGNRRKGTLRGMHYQVAPHPETKLVQCTSGSIFDVIIDLRKSSPTFLQHLSIELSSRNHRMLYIPEGFAHGFQTLEDHTEVCYQMSDFYAPECARGVRWNDPVFGIQWPSDTRVISARDQSYPGYRSA